MFKLATIFVTLLTIHAGLPSEAADSPVVVHEAYSTTGGGAGGFGGGDDSDSDSDGEIDFDEGDYALEDLYDTDEEEEEEDSDIEYLGPDPDRAVYATPKYNPKSKVMVQGSKRPPAQPKRCPRGTRKATRAEKRKRNIDEDEVVCLKIVRKKCPKGFRPLTRAEIRKQRDKKKRCVRNRSPPPKGKRPTKKPGKRPRRQ